MPKPRSSYLLQLIVAISMSVSIALSAQESPDVMAETALYSHTNELIQSGNLIEAIPYMQELIYRYSSLTEKQETVRMLDYFMAVAHLHLFNRDKEPDELKKAVRLFDEYADRYPEGEHLMQVHEKKAECLLVLKKFQEAALAYVKLYEIYKASGAAEKTTFFLKRIVDSFYKSKKWADGEPWFARAFQELRSKSDKAFAAAGLVEVYSERLEVDKVIKLMSVIAANKDVRYSLPLNMQYLKLGTKMLRAENYDMALYFYNNVFGLATIKEYHDKRLPSLQKQVDRLRPSSKLRQDEFKAASDELAKFEAKIKWLDTVSGYEPALVMKKARALKRLDRNYEAFSLLSNIIKRFPDFSSMQDVYYLADVYAFKIGLTEQRIALALDYLERFTEGKYYGDFVTGLGRIYLDSQDYEKLYPLMYDYLREYVDTQYSQQCLMLLGNAYMTQEMYSELISRFERLKNGEMGKTVWVMDLDYWLGMANLISGQYENALEHFNAIQKDAVALDAPAAAIESETYYIKDSAYRIGLCHMGMEAFDKAKETFEYFIKKYPELPLRGEVEYFLAEILYADSELETSLAHYSRVSQFTPNISFIEKACFQIGAINSEMRNYEEVVKVYGDFRAKYQQSTVLSDIVFRQCKALIELQRADEVCSLYDLALSEYGNDRLDVGVDKILDDYMKFYRDNLARIKHTMEFIENALDDDDFREKLIKDKGYLYEYFADHENLDDRLYEPFRRNVAYEEREAWEELLEVYNRQLNAFPMGTAESRLTSEYERAESEGKKVYALRLQRILDESGIRNFEGASLTEDDFSSASASTLVWIGKKLGVSNAELARKAFLLAIDMDVESDTALNATFAMGQLAEQQGQHSEAMRLYQQGLDLFPGSDLESDLNFSKASVLSKQKSYDDAIKLYEGILGRPDWRGEAHARALYNIGLIHYSKEDDLKAHGFFERTFIAYSYFKEWSSRAYLMDGKILMKLGRTQDAKKTFGEYLENNEDADGEVHREIVKHYSKL